MTAARKPSAKARRSAARLAAVQALYQIASTGVPVETVIGEFVQHRFESEIDGERLVRPDPDLFATIVRGVRERDDDLKSMVAGALDERWSVERLERLLSAILCAGAWELMAQLDLDARIVIAEYVALAHDFFGGKEPAMVNAVLDRLARGLRPDEMAVAADPDGA